ncbi:hypothetical protein FNF31_05822 [Cafeteria roenbergensis]|uniref:RING-type domain-containing protein n=1 Tax=Cafeteria roenbergensis TaxID=33653 RepID=A0A5A8CW93_CAFRO|nr:hypothetical protein FNF31_05822 [Cafeteria roenbergensis]
MVAHEMHRLGGAQAAADVALAAASTGRGGGAGAPGGPATKQGRKGAAAAAASAVVYGARWRRVVLDEAHAIKNTSTDTSRSCLAIEAVHRWALTGTPVQNSLKDLHSLVRFMRHQPWDEPAWWRRVIAQPFEAGDPRALPTLQALLRPLLLRRTKGMRDVDGRPIVVLPPKSEELVWLALSESERAFYDAIYSRSKATFEGFEAAGTVLNQYAVILSLLVRLRQACDHPFLVLGRRSNGPKLGDSPDDDADSSRADGAGLSSALVTRLLRRFMDSQAAQSTGERPAPGSAQDAWPESGARTGRVQAAAARVLAPHVLDMVRALRADGWAGRECPVCLDSLVAPVLTSCAHLLCDTCLRQCFASSTEKRCPVCRVSLPDRRDVIAISSGADPTSKLPPPQRAAAASSGDAGHNEGDAVAAPCSATVPADAYTPSTKLAELFRCLDAVERHNRRCRRRRDRLLGSEAVPAAAAVVAAAAAEEAGEETGSPEEHEATTASDSDDDDGLSGDSDFEEPAAAAQSPDSHRGGVMAPADDDGAVSVLSSGDEAVSFSDSSSSDNDEDDEDFVTERAAPAQLAPIFGGADAGAAGAAASSPAATPGGGQSPRGDEGDDAAFGTPAAWAHRGDPIAEEAWPGERLFADVGIYSVPTEEVPTAAAGGKLEAEEARSSALAIMDGPASDGALWRSLWLGDVKVVVFSQFTSMLDVVQAGLRRRGTRFGRIDGSMTQPRRDAALASFRQRAGANVLLVSTKAGGQGLNVVEACVVFILDPWWNPATEQQAISRVHRIGQRRRVTVKRLLCSDTVEETLIELQRSKQQLADSALEAGATASSGKLTLDDLRRFFR